ncbi:hypothetical protein TNIN_353981 [Trichonephila inaurata madagascariensis]|uniref:Uncharacterized protein n=1 Tax=Trichonephila inaurata madagascariensis TaxID=2747483 RepID=A0A8X6XPH6_9ARAC|nr:hypothetical protein TNIN_353981 [Trichonephila inaurata madagascariensis]
MVRWKGSMRETTNQLSNTCGLSRGKASTRQMLSWTFTESKPTVTIGDEVLFPDEAKGILGVRQLLSCLTQKFARRSIAGKTMV